MANNAFPFGQIVKKPDFPYFYSDSNLTISKYDNRPSDSIDEGIIFEDAILIPSSGYLLEGNHYLLRVNVKRNLSQQKYNVSLITVNDSQATNITSQYIGSYDVPIQVTNEDTSTIEIMFTPKTNGFNYILFALERTIKDDYSEYDSYSTEEQSIGRQAWKYITPVFLGRFTNILNQNNSTLVLVKMGIQATPGSLFCVNGQAIRVGPSGLYQINNGYEINFLGAAVKEQLKSNNSSQNQSTSSGMTDEQFYDYEYFAIDYREKT